MMLSPETIAAHVDAAEEDALAHPMFLANLPSEARRRVIAEALFRMLRGDDYGDADEWERLPVRSQ